MKKIIGYYFLLLSSIIGAGLITGQEIVSFFGGFNYKTIIAIIFSCALTGLLLYKALCSSESEAYQKIKANKVYKVFVVISCVIVAGAMVASVNEFSVRGGLPQIIGIIVLVLASLFGGKFSGLFKKLSKVICVFIIIAFIIVVAKASSGSNEFVRVIGTHNFVKCFCFATFNVFLLLPLAEESGADLTKKQRIILAVLLATSLCAIIAFGCYASSFVGGGMPLVTVASKLGWFYYAYVVVSFLAILTTLFTDLYAIKEVCGKQTILYIIMVALIYVVSLFGFESIIEYFYLIIGVIGSVVLLGS